VLANSVGIIRWNWHKKYLLQLAGAPHNVSVVPTTLIPQRSKATDVRQALTKLGWTNGVLKPCISAGGEGCTLIRSIDSVTSDDEKEWEALLADNDCVCDRLSIFAHPYTHDLLTMCNI
jgi:formate-dependent phosphoribosylglycinamide formyltransferase (GAR transformylase)